MIFVEDLLALPFEVPAIAVILAAQRDCPLSRASDEAMARIRDKQTWPSLLAEMSQDEALAEVQRLASLATARSQIEDILWLNTTTEPARAICTACAYGRCREVLPDVNGLAWAIKGIQDAAKDGLPVMVEYHAYYGAMSARQLGVEEQFQNFVCELGHFKDIHEGGE